MFYSEIIMSEEKENIEKKLERSATQIKNMVSSEFRDILDFVKKPWKLIWVNFLIGIARGVGLVIGMTILGAVLVAMVFFVLNKMVNLPVIGSYIAQIIAEVKRQLASIPR
ncbi:MAG TPA: hypothetical protein DCX95_06270 [Elusimicrobia bacterium]|nr:hypothetical protein [Elusimicrobiota bacterium]